MVVLTLMSCIQAVIIVRSHANSAEVKGRNVMRILPLLLVPALAAGVAYWLTRSRTAALATGAVVLGAMLFIGITS